MAEEVGTDRYDAQLRLQATRVDERPGLASITCPTLVLAARQDRLCPVERHEEIAARVPGAELVVLEDCAHLSPLEQPAVVSAHLRRWLARRRECAPSTSAASRTARAVRAERCGGRRGEPSPWR